MADGWRLWSYWHRVAWPDNTAEFAAVEADAGRNLTYVWLVGRRRDGVVPTMPGPINCDRFRLNTKKRPCYPATIHEEASFREATHFVPKFSLRL
jgi:hypothetical protein